MHNHSYFRVNNSKEHSYRLMAHRSEIMA